MGVLSIRSGEDFERWEAVLSGARTEAEIFEFNRKVWCPSHQRPEYANATLCAPQEVREAA